MRLIDAFGAWWSALIVSILVRRTPVQGLLGKGSKGGGIRKCHPSSAQSNPQARQKGALAQEEGRVEEADNQLRRFPYAR